MAKNPYKRMRSLTDQELNAALLHHAEVLRGLSRGMTRLLRERWQGLLWGFLVTLGLIWSLVWSHTPDNLLEWVR